MRCPSLTGEGIVWGVRFKVRREISAYSSGSLTPVTTRFIEYICCQWKDVTRPT